MIGYSGIFVLKLGKINFEICDFLEYHAGYNCSLLSTFRDTLSVPSARVKQPFFPNLHRHPYALHRVFLQLFVYLTNLMAAQYLLCLTLYSLLRTINFTSWTIIASYLGIR